MAKPTIRFKGYRRSFSYSRQPHHSSPAKVRRNKNLEEIHASKNVSAKWTESSRD